MRRTAGSARVSRLSVSCDYAFSKRVSMQFIDYYADVCGSDTNDNNNKKVSEEPAYDREVIDDTEIENDPSDYYDLTNVTRSASEAEEDAFSLPNKLRL